MARKERQHTLLDSAQVRELQPLGTLVSGSPVTPNTNVVATFDRERTMRHMRLTLTNFVVSIAGADDYGGTKLCDLPDSNLMLMGCEANLELVKGEVSTGIEAATDLSVGIGTAAASNATLSGTMQNLIEVDALTATDASPAWVAHSQDNATTVPPILVADGASNALYLNMAALITVDDAVTVSGTIDLFYHDLGNVTS